MPVLSNSTNTVSNDQNNIDSSIIESIHNQIFSNNISSGAPNLEPSTTSKKIISKRRVKKEPASANGSLDGILNLLDIQPTQNITPELPTITDNTLLTNTLLTNTLLTNTPVLGNTLLTNTQVLGNTPVLGNTLLTNTLLTNTSVLGNTLLTNTQVLGNTNQDKIIRLSSGSSITHIYHISDIHIQLYKCHQEYRDVFQRVYDYLIKEKTASGISASQNRDCPFLVVITGDILHSKTDLSPECIQLTYSFIKTLASIMPVVLIAGNHDININNRDRLDSLTPILADLPSVAPVYYLLESGIYQFGNVLFYYSSILDSKVVIQPRIQTAIESGLVHIGLYHGRVNGAVYFNGMAFHDSDTSVGTGPGGNKTITPSAFAEYDITMLGDIHKHQFMTPNIAYAGSLIQQNHGEDIGGHGLIKWSLATYTGVHIPIYNDWSYVSIRIANKKANFLCTAADGTHMTDCPLTKNISLRILYHNTPESYLSDYITLMKMNHNIVEFRWNCDDSQQPITLSMDSMQIDSTNTMNMNMNASANANANANMINKNRASLVDITSPEVQFAYLADIIQDNYPDITPAELASIKTINQEQNDLLRATSKQFNTQGFNGHYKILRLEFSNLFSFSESNIIEFREFQGIVGIIAPNHLGKSSILDIIVYTLFDEFTRKGSVKDIININRDNFSIRMELQIGEWIYIIQKMGQRTKIGASVQVRFSRKHSKTGVIERLEEDSVLKTKEKILEHFGCYEDMIHTSFSIQHDNACFIDSTNVKRKEELERIMRFEIVKKLYEQVNQRFNRDKAVYEHIEKKVNRDEYLRLKNDKVRLIKLLEIILSDREYARSRIRGLHQSILEESGKLHKECDAFLADNNECETRELLESLEEELLENENKLESLKTNQSSQLENPINLANATPEELKQHESTQVSIIAETNKKIKAITQSLEKLYKNRKPIYNNNNNTTLADHHSKLLQAKQRLEADLVATNQNIIELKELEVQNQTRQEQILALEKQRTRLPPQLQAVIDKAADDGVDAEYMKEVFLEALEEFITHLPKTPNASRAFSKYLESAEYNSLCRAARDFFLYQELIQYQDQTQQQTQHQTQQQTQQQSNNSTDASIKSHQSVLEFDIAATKKHISAKLPAEEVRRNTITGKLATLANQIKLLETDIINTEANNKLDEEIQTLQTKRTRYETRIETAETILQAIRTRTLALVEIDKLELASRRLVIEIKDATITLEQFETYRGQIEANKPIQDRIAALKVELAEFEEVLELVEARMQKEQTINTEIISKLEQMTRDIIEGRDLEANLRLLEMYRTALKELPYILLGKIQPLLEKKVNDLLAITTDFSVRFDMSDSKIDIYLDRAIYKDKSRAILINNASGFERFMASLAIRLALLDLSNLPKINFIAIDEGWSSFDNHNINNVSLILDYLTSKFDFVLTISHLIQIKEHCDMQISLRRDDKGFSKIVY